MFCVCVPVITVQIDCLKEEFEVYQLLPDGGRMKRGGKSNMQAGSRRPETLQSHPNSNQSKLAIQFLIRLYDMHYRAADSAMPFADGRWLPVYT